MSDGPIESLSAVTLAVTDMARSTAFYERLGFQRLYGGETDAFTSFQAGPGFLNLELVEGVDVSGGAKWGRAIFYVGDVDGMHDRAIAAGLHPESEPTDAPWGERYFHLHDPDGHELSFARPLEER